MKIDDRGGLALISEIPAGDVDALHQVKNRCPARDVKAFLKNVVGLVTARAAISEYALQPSIVWRAVRQRGQQLITGQLAFKILQRLQCEILMPRSSQVHFGTGGLEGVGLCPNFVFSLGQRRKIVIALLIGEDASGDVPPLRFG